MVFLNRLQQHVRNICDSEDRVYRDLMDLSYQVSTMIKPNDCPQTSVLPHLDNINAKDFLAKWQSEIDWYATMLPKEVLDDNNSNIGPSPIRDPGNTNWELKKLAGYIQATDQGSIVVFAEPVDFNSEVIENRSSDGNPLGTRALVSIVATLIVAFANLRAQSFPLVKPLTHTSENVRDFVLRRDVRAALNILKSVGTGPLNLGGKNLAVIVDMSEQQIDNAFGADVTGDLNDILNEIAETNKINNGALVQANPYGSPHTYYRSDNYSPDH
ncbi:hypothetical protein GGR57DRAFT_512426 [Xylariaceae sp. FL1272]|nr:hypothetical protein GGR57DRAFT_512426 [Xylariaceae sp. FL1272]